LEKDEQRNEGLLKSQRKTVAGRRIEEQKREKDKKT